MKTNDENRQSRAALACGVVSVHGIVPRTDGEAVRLWEKLRKVAAAQRSKIYALPVSHGLNVDEIATQAFTKLSKGDWLVLRRFRNQSSSLDTYLAKLTRHLIIDWYRKRSSVEAMVTTSLDQMVDNGQCAQLRESTAGNWASTATPFDNICSMERVQAIQEAIAAIKNPTHRRIMELTVEGYGPSEIARILGISETAVSTVRSRCRNTLKQELATTSWED